MIHFKSVEISGFGKDTSYELGCQIMLFLGLEWLKGKPVTIWGTSHGYPQIYGVFKTSAQLKELEDIWMVHPYLKENGMTGAMHQAVMQHLLWIHHHTFDAWLLERCRPDSKSGESDTVEVFDIPETPEEWEEQYSKDKIAREKQDAETAAFWAKRRKEWGYPEKICGKNANLDKSATYSPCLREEGHEGGCAHNTLCKDPSCICH